MSSWSGSSDENIDEWLTSKAFSNLDEKIDPQYILQKLVIDSTSPIYGFWSILLVLLNALTCLVYPYAVAYNFRRAQIIPLIIAEFFIFFDIVMNFFLSYKNDGDPHLEKDFQKISKRYLFGKFKRDFIMFLPLGLIGEI